MLQIENNPIIYNR